MSGELWFKKCVVCGAIKAIVEFNLKGRGTERRPECRNCRPERLSEHPSAWVHREHNWRRRGVECISDCSANGGFLCRTHYLAVLELQRWKCAVCGRIFWRGVKPYPTADHEHRDVPNVKGESLGPFRGILCGGRNGCNLALSRYETRIAKGEYGTSPDQDAAFAAYLADPPASRLSRTHRLRSRPLPPPRARSRPRVR
jgi:transposase-like protein